MTRLSRDGLIEAMAGHVLRHGLNTASLRPLARAAGTSDRMLIYHFGSKDRLVGALLQALAGDMARRLEAALPAEPAASPRALLGAVLQALDQPAFRPYLRLWLDILAAAGQGSALHRETGQAILGGFLDWVAARLPADEPDRAGTAALLLTFVEGAVVMDLAGRPETARLAAERLFAGPGQAAPPPSRPGPSRSRRAASARRSSSRS